MESKESQVQELDLFGHTPKEKEMFGLVNDWLLKEAQKPGGCACPLCKQHVQIYHRTITSSMAHGLILIYRYYQKHDRSKSLQVEGYLKRLNISSTIRGDIAKLCFWGLLKKMEGKRPDGSNRNGHYFLTEKGAAFVQMLTTVPKYCTVYNRKSYGLFGDLVTIKDCLKNKFNYDDLMKGK